MIHSIGGYASMRANSNHWLAKALGVVMLLTVLTLAGCGGGGSGTGAGPKPGAGLSLTIRSKNGPAGQLLAGRYSPLLQNHGFNVPTKLPLGQTPGVEAAIRRA